MLGEERETDLKSISRSALLLPALRQYFFSFYGYERNKSVLLTSPKERKKLKESNLRIYSQPCWCRWPCSGIMPGKFGSVCCPLISNLMLLLMLLPPFVRLSSGSMLVGATLSSVVDGVIGGSDDASNDASWSWLCVCSWRGCWKVFTFSGTVERVGTLDALCNVCTRGNKSRRRRTREAR